MEQEHTWAKFLEGSLSEEEKLEIKKDPDYAIYQQIKKYSAALSVPSDEEGEALLLDNIMGAPKVATAVPRHTYSYRWLTAAAAVLLFLLGGAGYLWSGAEHFSAGVAANVHVQLPDASEVDLRSKGTLSFNRVSWAWQRVAQLNGEAYFDVEKGSVFTVETSLGTVRVLGTRFDVSNRDGHFSVNCYHGKVEVKQAGTTLVIHEGQSLQVKGDRWERDSLFLKEPAWKQGQLIFKSAALAGVLKELADTYNLQMILKTDKAIGEKEFSGTLPFDNRETAIQIVEKAFSVSCIKVGADRYEVKRK